MYNRHVLTMNRPTEWFGSPWKEAIPLGDGITGAMVYGGIQKETVTLTRHDLWHWGEESPLPDVRQTLACAREALDKGDYAFANGLLSDSLNEKGYKSNPAVPFPIADLSILMGNEGCFFEYQRQLDMREAEARIGYQQGKIHFYRRCMISKENGILFYEIQMDCVCPYLDVEVIFHQDGTGNTDRMRAEHQDDTIAKAELYDGDGYFYWRQRNGEKGDYGVVARIVCDSGNIEVYHQKIRTKQVRKLTILLRTFSGESYEEAFGKYKEELSRRKPGYDTYRPNHLALHQKLYDSCRLFLGEIQAEGSRELTCQQLLDAAYQKTASLELLEKLWHFGRYLFICGTAAGGSPFPLYGLWNGEYHPVWAQNVANENVEMIYWHIHTGGLNELLCPLIDYYYAMIPKMRENAQKLFGCRGIFLSCYTTRDNAYVSPVVPVITNWIGGAGWVCQHFFRYYQYSGDKTLFREKILPFMLEAARFYCDYAVFEEDGGLKIYPSVSPENSPGNFIKEGELVHLGHAMPAVKNATMDFAIIKELLSNLLSVSDDYPELDTEKEEWKKVLEAIPAYQINEDGAVKEWMSPELKDFYCHRHLSHLYPVFPGNEVTRKEGKLWKAFERAVDLRELGGQSGWSLVHMASLYARLGRGEDSINCMDLLIKGVTLQNLMMISNDYRNMGVTMDVGQFAPIQLDANLGYVHALQEMLFHQDGEVLYLLPACPKRMESGCVEDFCFTGGKISFEWNLQHKNIRIEIHIEKNEKWSIAVPDGWRIDSCEVLSKDHGQCMVNGVSYP